MTADDQRGFWNGDAGGTWVRQQAAFDALMQPVLDALLNKAALPGGARVLDIGCGTGQSALRAAKSVGPSGHVTGIDISVPMLTLAAHRTRDADNITLIEADAASHVFAPHSFDHLVSRFGVMFFTDTTSAFAHIRRSLVPCAAVTFATWGTIAGNPWFTLPAQAAKTVLGAPPPVDADAPGPFALRDVGLTVDMLNDAGFSAATAEIVELALTPEGTLQDTVAFAISAGPPKRAIDHFNASQAEVAQIETELGAFFAPHETSEGLRIPAEINIFSARA